VTGDAILEAGRHSASLWRRQFAWIVLGSVPFAPSVRATPVRLAEWRAPDVLERELGSFLAGRLAPTDSLLVWGAEAEIYFFARREPANRFIYKYPLPGDGPFAARARRRFMAEVTASRPGAIVVVRNDETSEDGMPSDREWETYWAPAFRSLLRSYSRTTARGCLLYLRRD
jgi:hypothetical protein